MLVLWVRVVRAWSWSGLRHNLQERSLGGSRDPIRPLFFFLCAAQRAVLGAAHLITGTPSRGQPTAQPAASSCLSLRGILRQPRVHEDRSSQRLQALCCLHAFRASISHGTGSGPGREAKARALSLSSRLAVEDSFEDSQAIPARRVCNSQSSRVNQPSLSFSHACPSFFPKPNGQRR